MALRLAQQREDRLQAAGDEEGATVTDLASVRAVAKRTGAAAVDEPSRAAELFGDDDDPVELDARRRRRAGGRLLRRGVRELLVTGDEDRARLHALAQGGLV